MDCVASAQPVEKQQTEQTAKEAAQLREDPAALPGPDDPGHHLRGVSATYMDGVFMGEMADEGLPATAKVWEVEPLVIRGKGKDIICPRDGKRGAAYVDCVPNEHGGLASVMLSYGWAYSMRDVVDTLLQFCDTSGLDPNVTRFWICCVCINQQ